MPNFARNDCVYVIIMTPEQWHARAVRMNAEERPTEVIFGPGFNWEAWEHNQKYKPKTYRYVDCGPQH